MEKINIQEYTIIWKMTLNLFTFQSNASCKSVRYSFIHTFVYFTGTIREKVFFILLSLYRKFYVHL